MSIRFYISCDINIALNHIFGIKKIDCVIMYTMLLWTSLHNNVIKYVKH